MVRKFRKMKLYSDFDDMIFIVFGMVIDQVTRFENAPLEKTDLRLPFVNERLGEILIGSKNMSAFH